MKNTQTFENDTWICEIEMTTGVAFGVYFNIAAKNKETGELVNKQYRTNIIQLNKTIQKIKKDFGGYDG